jgi:formylglycine-generating enzyme
VNGTHGMLLAIATLVVAIGGLAGCTSSSGTAATHGGPDATSEPAPSETTPAGDGGMPGAPSGGDMTIASSGDGGPAGADAGGGGSGGSPAEAGSTGTANAGSPGEGGASAMAESGSTAPIPNCATAAAGVTNCGDGGLGTESCCTSLPVTGGTFFRTYTYGETSSYADPATVSGFRLDKYLVTVGRFRQYVSYLTSSAGAPPASGSGKHIHLNGGQGLANSGSPGTYESGWGATAWNALNDSLSGLPDIASGPGAASIWNTNLACDPGYATWTAAPGSGENLPINCVDWYEAYAFCIWDGGFLPSEAEWEYAAAGGSQQREYPWGATAPGMTNQYAIYGDGESECYYPSGTATACTGVANFAPVGTAIRGAGDFGQLDLVGEVFEWNLDWYATYATCTDCADLTPASNRVMRGDLLNDVSVLVPSSRFDVDPSYRAVNLGFRCARAPIGTATPSGASTTTMMAAPSPAGAGTASGSQGQTVPGMDAAVVAPADCTIPSPVSFQTDVQTFLNASCGKTGTANASNGGCHVLDDESTVIEGGKNHAYDWITGTAHDTSCPQTPTPLRFQVVMAVMQEANPPSCSKSDIMPPASTPPRTPLTACQMAILQSWLDEPYVTQLHRYDGISPTTPYAMPPFN